jgi:hypothetical protein
MRTLVCSVPYRLKVQNFAHLQVFSLLLGDVGCYRINLVLNISPVRASVVRSETVYGSIAQILCVHAVLQWFSKTINAISP